MHKLIGLICIFCPVLVIAGVDEAYAAAGQFQFIAGEVKVLDRAGSERIAKKGMDVNEGDTVATTDTASAQIRMVDGGIMAVRPDSRLKVETFIFNGKEDGQERSLILLLKGGFRAITGLIGKLNHSHYLIRTPTATIGIRGTDHEPMYIPQPSPGAAVIGVPGTYDKVNLGAAFIKTDLGIIQINPNQVGFVAGADKIPQLLPKIPDFYKPDAGKPNPSNKSDASDLRKKDLKSGSLRGESNLKGGQLNLEGSVAPSATSTLAAPTSTLKDTSTTLIAPTTLQIAPTTTLVAPTTTLKDTSTTLVAPTTTLIAPTTSTTTVLEPTTTLVAPTTLTAPTTTLIAPTTTLVAPTTTLTAPTTTLIAPTTTIKLAP